MRTLPYAPKDRRGIQDPSARQGEQWQCVRTFAYDLPQCIIPDDPDFLRGELLAQLIVGAGELGLVVLGDRARLAVTVSSHSNIYSVKERNVAGEGRVVKSMQ